MKLNLVRLFIVTLYNGFGYFSKSESDLVSFDGLEEFKLKDYVLKYALCIQPDILNPGGFLIADQHAIIYVHPNRSYSNLTGKSKP